MEREELEAVVIGWTDKIIEIERLIQTANNSLLEVKKEIKSLHKTIKPTLEHF